MTDEPTRAHERFRILHEDGTFLMPNAWDVGSARLLESLGFRPSLRRAPDSPRPRRADQQTTLDGSWHTARSWSPRSTSL